MSQFFFMTTAVIVATFGISYVFMQATVPTAGQPEFLKGSPHEKYTSPAYEQQLIGKLRRQVREKIAKESEE